MSLNLGEALLENEARTEAIGFDSFTGLPLSFGGKVYGYELTLAIGAVAYGGGYGTLQEPDNDLYVRAVDFLNSY